MKDKIDTLIGFAVKARKIVFGADFIEKSPRVCLIICCKSLSENSLKRMIAVAGEKIPLVISQNPFEDIVYKKGVKAAGITDRQMASAILKNIGDNYELFCGQAP